MRLTPPRPRNASSTFSPSHHGWNVWIASQAQVVLKPGEKYDLGWGVDGIRVVDCELNKRLTISWQEADEAPTEATWLLERIAGQDTYQL